MAVVDPGAITDPQLNQAIGACAADNPCEAAWQASYAYAADQAYKLAIFQALQGIAFGIIQYASADRTADLQYDIANRQMLIAEEEYQRYKDHYVECEDALAAEICALEIPEVDYDVRANRALRDVRRNFTNMRIKLERSRNRYCCADAFRELYELEKAETLAVIQARDISYRYAEKRQDFLDERRWNRRVVILQHGRNIMSGQSQMYQSASQQAINALGAEQEALDNFLGTISGGIGSIANARYARNIANYANAPQHTGQGMIHSAIPTPSGITTNGMVSGVRAF